jgi:hypothetical protein
VERAVFKVGDVVRFKILNSPAKIIMEGSIIKVVPPNVNIKDVLSEDSFRSSYDTSKISCVGSRGHYSYIISDRHSVPNRRARIYWPLVSHIFKPDSN